MTFLLLGNVAAAARANDKYESHIQTVNLHILKTENEVAWIDTTLKINNYKSSSIDSDSEEERLRVLLMHIRARSVAVRPECGMKRR